MGHIKIDRKILNWEWYTDINTSRLFLHLLLRANWKDGRFQGVVIPRGSLAISYQNLATETGMSVRNVRTALEHLKSTGEVTVSRQPKFSVITIKNYCYYQSGDTVTDNQLTSNRQPNDSQPTTIEEGKKGRKDINTSSDEEVTSREPEKESVFATIREFYNSVCGSYPRLVKMSDKRKKAIRARLRTGYTIDDFKRLFEKAEASDFLKGKNSRDWQADFDWLICDSNMAKTLEGRYDNKPSAGDGRSYDSSHGEKSKNRFNNFPQRENDYKALERMLLEAQAQGGESG